MFVVQPTLTVSDRRIREIMATQRGKMINVCGVTRHFSDANKITLHQIKKHSRLLPLVVTKPDDSP